MSNIRNRTTKLQVIRTYYQRTGRKMSFEELIMYMNPRQLHKKKDMYIYNKVTYCGLYCVLWCISSDFIAGWLTGKGLKFNAIVDDRELCGELIDDYFYGDWANEEWDIT